MVKKFDRRIFLCIMLLVMAASLMAWYYFTQKVNVAKKAAEEVVLHDPLIVKDSTMNSFQKVTWDCIWFGSYPQTEVKETDSEYELLKSTKDWDSNGDAIINGTKYRRMLKDDAAYVFFIESEYYDFYNWEDDTTYHYFRYEPIKWRVLKTGRSKVMLLSDIILDTRKYSSKCESTTWETCTVRSWLNGYSGDMNQEGIDYNSGNFIDSAFTDEEKSAISDTVVVNSNSLRYDIEGGNDTIDKLFLLSESEIYTYNYGFIDSFISDEARMCKSSDYAKAMGACSNKLHYNGNCSWWLRSPGCDSDCAVCVGSSGDINYRGDVVYSDYTSYGVRVALNLNPYDSNQYTYAGTVCSEEQLVQ
ncbi:MAG: hypothetical protein HDT39_06705 [Lachnospiraceae bacterium]|nr:hypothetical protein [Lachnospiraceae bacterium]